MIREWLKCKSEERSDPLGKAKRSMEMEDLVFVVVILAFFLASYGFVHVCERLRR